MMYGFLNHSDGGEFSDGKKRMFAGWRLRCSQPTSWNIITAETRSTANLKRSSRSGRCVLSWLSLCDSVQLEREVYHRRGQRRSAYHHGKTHGSEVCREFYDRP